MKVKYRYPIVPSRVVEVELPDGIEGEADLMEFLLDQGPTVSVHATSFVIEETT